MLVGLFICACASGPSLLPTTANKALSVAQDIYREDEGGQGRVEEVQTLAGQTIHDRAI